MWLSGISSLFHGEEIFLCVVAGILWIMLIAILKEWQTTPVLLPQEPHEPNEK